MGNITALPAANEPSVTLMRPTGVVTSRFVTIELAAALTGLTEGAIRMKIAKGIWLEDRQYVRRDGRVLIDLRGCDELPQAQTLAERDAARMALKGFHRAKRRAAELQRTPAWADLDAMRSIYAEAQRLKRETGVPHHVDHEIPLQGKLVSGLHVHNNLQILTGSENSRKKNRFEVK